MLSTETLLLRKDRAQMKTLTCSLGKVDSLGTRGKGSYLRRGRMKERRGVIFSTWFREVPLYPSKTNKGLFKQD